MVTTSDSINSGNSRLKLKVMGELEGGLKKGFLELASATGGRYSDLVAALEGLMAEGSVVKSSDGFETVYSRRA